MNPNVRNLPINPHTGRYVDYVAAAYRDHLESGGDLTFEQWHDSKLCPQHQSCNLCVR